MITLQPTCENPDELIAGFGAGARILIQSSTTETGAYAAITTIPLVPGERSYTYEHLAGTSSTWYRWRFEDATGSNANDWGAVFQPGDETGGQLCSVYDVQQELGQPTNAQDDESIQEKIRQVSTSIERYTGRWFSPRPLNGTKTLLFDGCSGYELHIPKGIRSITSLSIANEDQPETLGTYTTSSDHYIYPPSGEREPGEPGYWVRLRTTGNSWFYDAAFGVSITGAFGWAAVPADIQGVAIRAATRRFIGKSSGGASFAVGPSGTEFLLPDISGADRATLDTYRRISIG